MSKSQKKTVLVTGAAGFIAHSVISKLLERNYLVIGIDNFDSFYDRELKERNIETLKRHFLKENFIFLEKDIRTLQITDFANASIEGIIHLAAKAGVIPSLRDPKSYFSVNVEGTLHLLELAKNLSIEKICFASSSSVYGERKMGQGFRESDATDLPISPYAASKKAAEVLITSFVNAYSFRASICRIFTAYGPRQRPDLAISKFVRKIMQEEEVTLFGSPTSARDYTYVEDIAEGLILAYEWLSLQKEKTVEVFNLGNHHPVSLKELIDGIETALEKKARVLWEPPRVGDVGFTCADITKSRSVLSYQPKTSFELGLRNFVAWIKETLALSPSVFFENRKLQHHEV